MFILGLDQFGSLCNDVLCIMLQLLTDTVVNPRDIDIGEEDIFGMEEILTNVVRRPYLDIDNYSIRA